MGHAVVILKRLEKFWFSTMSMPIIIDLNDLEHYNSLQTISFPSYVTLPSGPYIRFGVGGSFWAKWN